MRSEATVCLFVYKRVETLRRTVASLLQNERACRTDLYIFSDGPANAGDEDGVNQVRGFVRGIIGFHSVRVRESVSNMGLAASIIDGVSDVICQEGRVIVLEDDLVVSPNFLDFMNASLDHYEQDGRIFSIAGYSLPMTGFEDRDVYFTLRGSSWGWATWRDRWEKVDWTVSDFQDLNRSRSLQRAFNRMGSDLTAMLRKQHHGVIDSWAIRWTYHQFRRGIYTVHPIRSKVMNKGFGEGATHTRGGGGRFSTVLDMSGRKEFDFPLHPFIDPAIIRRVTRPYSLRTRAWYKLRTIFSLQ